MAAGMGWDTAWADTEGFTKVCGWKDDSEIATELGEDNEDEDEDEDEEEDEDEDEEGPWFPEEPMPDEQELRAQIAREKAEIEERRRQFQLHELEQQQEQEQQQITTTRRVPTIPHPLIWEWNQDDSCCFGCWLGGLYYQTKRGGEIAAIRDRSVILLLSIHPILFALDPNAPIGIGKTIQTRPLLWLAQHQRDLGWLLLSVFFFLILECVVGYTGPGFDSPFIGTQDPLRFRFNLRACCGIGKKNMIVEDIDLET